MKLKGYPGYSLELQNIVTGYVTAGIVGPNGNFITGKEYPPDVPLATVVREARAWLEENRPEHHKHLLEAIPAGCYCYDAKGVCPYFSRTNYPGYPKGSNAGKCALTGVEHDVCLDDMCKVCGINDASHDYTMTVFGLRDDVDQATLGRAIETYLQEKFNAIVRPIVEIEEEASER